MPTYTEDLTIIGNGVIGSLTALLAAKAGLKVALVGPWERPGAASTAAGAMLNVYGEIDGPLDDYGRRKLKIGLEGIKRWREILPPEVFVADKTHVFLKSDATDHERACFEAMKRAEGARGEQNYGASDLLILFDEPAIDTRLLFKWLDDQLRQHVALHQGANYWGGATSVAPKTVYCAGAFTPQAMQHPGALHKQPLKILPVFYGIGTAMHLGGVKIDVPPRTVVRSPNRGNTCGIHVVPRGPDAYYVGAGSYISRTPDPGIRLETIKYLTDCLLKDFNADIWRAKVTPVVGFRPMSLDGKPMLGPLKADDSVYVATGTKRDGLTYAPVIADDIIRWATGTERTGVFDGWEPDREPISYAEPHEARLAYVNNRLAAMQEHGREMLPQDAAYEYDRALLAAVTSHGPFTKFALHPELTGVFSNEYGCDTEGCRRVGDVNSDEQLCEIVPSWGGTATRRSLDKARRILFADLRRPRLDAQRHQTRSED